MDARTILMGLFLLILPACSAPNRASATEPERSGEATPSALDADQLDDILGMKGTQQDGQYKVTLPQSDLSVTVDGFQIIPPMGLTSWAAFAPTPMGGAVVMGDLVVQEDEIAAVEATLVGGGLTVSGLHNHFVRDEPKVMFMHIHGVGTQQQLAQGVRRTFDQIRDLRRQKGLSAQSWSLESSLETAVIDARLGTGGSMNSGVYKVTVGRPDVDLKDHGASVTSFLGFNTWMAFQGTSERAAVCGDFAMLESEVAPVIEALVKNGIEVVAVHNHMVTEDPRIFFLHFWGVGSIEELTTGLRAGLDQTGRH